MSAPETVDEADRQALADFAWIMSAFDRRDVEDTAVHVWRVRDKTHTEQIIDRWLSDDLRPEYEEQRRQEA